MEKTNKVVFQSCNQMNFGCEIIDRDRHYELRVQGIKDEWRSAYFDRNQAVLDAVVAMIERYGNPCYQKTGFLFREKVGRRWAHRATLSRVVFNAYYPGKTDEAYFCKKGCFKDGAEYTTVDWNSNEAKEIIMAAYAETKFGMEVYNLC